MATVSTSTPISATSTNRLRFKVGLAGFRTFLIYAILCGLSLFFLFPLVWMVSTSLKTVQEVGQPQLNLIPAQAGALTFTVRLRGKSAHACVRLEGVSAVEKYLVPLALIELAAVAVNDA